MMNKYSINSNLPILILVLVTAVFTVFGVKEVYRTSYLYTLDPGFHYTITQALDAQNPLGVTIPTYDGGLINAEYPSSMRTFLVAIHDVTNISYLDLFKLFGIFCRIFTVFIIFYVASYLFKNKIVALIISILFLSSRYVFFRAIITFPENLVIPFHILVFYEVVKSIRDKKIQIALPIFIASSLTIHYPSAIILVILLLPLAYFVVKDFIKKAQNRKKLFIQVLIFLILLLILSSPVLSSFLKRYQKYTVNNIGESAIESIAQQNNDRYNPISWSTFTKNIGTIALLLALISVPLLFYPPQREKTVLLIWLVVTFILTRGSQVSLFVPTGRMIIYFLIPIIFLSGYGLKKLFYLRQLKLVFSFLFLLLIINFVATINGIHGWVAISDSEIDQSKWLNNNIDNTTVLLVSNVHLENSGFMHFANLESREDIYSELYKNNLLNTGELKQLYPGKHVWLAINKTTSTLLLGQDYPIVFDENGNIVYDLGVQ